MSLKDEFLDLLEKDREFRYAVLGYLGLDEVIKRMDEHQKTQTEILERIKRIEQEQVKIWKEVKALREEQVRLREEQVRIGEELVRLREEQANLREEQVRIGEELVRLREDFNRMLARIERLEEGHRKLERAFERLEGHMLIGFDSLRKFAGVTFEEFVRDMLSRSLVKMGVLPDGARLEKVVFNGEEINLFFEDPLVVGEVTAHAESREEVDKLLRKAKIAKERYGKEPLLFLVVLTAPKMVAKEIRMLSEKYNIDLIIGQEV